ncbi:MAG: glycosyltransferase, partial [bacterium]|nr:glycosyltransferase [bacterium]
MNILIVCSGNSNQAVSFDMAKHRPFIYEQMRALNKNGIVTDTFFIRGNGITGYLSNLPALRERVKNGNYALVHAHNGLSALLANLQRIVPVVSTFHGSDLCSFKKRYFSYIAILLSRYVIYVSPLIEKRGRVVRKKDYTIIPCGIDTEIFYPIDKAEAREHMGLEQEQKYA